MPGGMRIAKLDAVKLAGIKRRTRIRTRMAASSSSIHVLTNWLDGKHTVFSKVLTGQEARLSLFITNTAATGHGYWTGVLLSRRILPNPGPARKRMEASRTGNDGCLRPRGTQTP